MTAFAEACKNPFSNGTEEREWMSKWCSYCRHDHGATHHDSCGDGCDLLLGYVVEPTSFWPEAWVPEPDDDRFFLPSRMVCLRFEPCTEGACKGDPGAEDRAERVAEVTAYWRDRR